jgi:hypothetical protein
MVYLSLPQIQRAICSDMDFNLPVVISHNKGLSWSVNQQ